MRPCSAESGSHLHFDLNDLVGHITNLHEDRLVADSLHIGQGGIQELPLVRESRNPGQVHSPVHKVLAAQPQQHRIVSSLRVLERNPKFCRLHKAAKVSATFMAKETCSCGKEARMETVLRRVSCGPEVLRLRTPPNPLKGWLCKGTHSEKSSFRAFMQ